MLILMGVSGVGKTTVGTLLAAEIGWRFLDADDFHPVSNKAKMAEGHPLTDEDREPWLSALYAKIAESVDAGKSLILACSALRETYRERLRGDIRNAVQFALLVASPEVLARRLAERQHEFMHPGLLGSQLTTLEQPEEAWIVGADGSAIESVESLKINLRAAGEIP